MALLIFFNHYYYIVHKNTKTLSIQHPYNI